MAKKECILVLGAHSDDFVIGAGGTIAKYAQEGKKIVSVVFSYGEKSHPWLKENVVQKFRAKEAFAASELLNCKTVFFDLKEGHFYEEYKEKGLEKDLLEIIKKEKPNKIFSHSNEDPHPDHKAIYKIVLELYDKVNYKPELYTYSVWNPISLKTKFPALYVDIRKTFSTKLQALRTFKSQQIHISYPVILLFFRAIKNGIKTRSLFGEKFYRIK
jgi:N-acetylglucosamine malate deacetylase 1